MAFLAVELQDKTGTVQARLPHLPERWEQLRDAPFVRALGACRKAEPHEAREGESELMVELASLEPVAHADPRELYEHTPADPDALLAELRRTFECEVEDAWVRRMLLAFLDDAPFVEKLKTAPAASSFHHAYVGGLLEHVASLTRLALKVCEVYPRLDRSLMIAGVFLHDVGKVDELSWERGLQYTDRGQILGHIAIGVLMLEDKIRAIPGFPSRLRDLLHHLILSHHGTKEFGSPVLPVTPEAIAVHHLDNVDGKLWSAWRAQDDPRGEPAWSPFNRHLGRKIYRGD
jgi:3'-5' exoribonuclease